MRRMGPILLFFVIIQLTTFVDIAFSKFFPKEPTKAFDIRSIGRIAYSPDGELLAITERRGFLLYDPETLTQVAHLGGEFGALWTITFSPDGTLLASAGGDSNIRLWNIATQEQIHAFTAHNSAVRSIDFGPDGTFLASASYDGTVRVWNLEKKRQVAALDIQKLTEHNPTQVIFSPNGSLVAISVHNGQLILWDFQTQKILRQIDHQLSFPEIALSLDGKTLLSIASTDNRGDLKFWDVETGKQIALQQQHPEPSPNNTPQSEYRCLFQLVAPHSGSAMGCESENGTRPIAG